jgi:hypothetical protein
MSAAIYFLVSATYSYFVIKKNSFSSGCLVSIGKLIMLIQHLLQMLTLALGGEFGETC